MPNRKKPVNNTTTTSSCSPSNHLYWEEIYNLYPVIITREEKANSND